MNKTDSPLKRLVQLAPIDFAEWLLNREVVTMTTANIELQPNPNPMYTDLVFWVTVIPSEEDKHEADPSTNDTDDEGYYRVLLHIEFQGESSKRPMRFRVLDYITGFADKERSTRIHSVVFYVGEKTNVTDIGYHQVRGIGQRVTLAWQYDIIRLWDLEPQTLLDENRPALLPLIGQAQIEQPEQIIPQVYEAITSVPDKEMQQRLLTELLALLQNEEIIHMIETMIEQDEWVLDTPYIRRWRRQVEEARLETLKELFEIRRNDILNLVLWRYNPQAKDYVQIQKFLSSVMSNNKFNTIMDAIMNVDDFRQFYKIVEEAASPLEEMDAVPA